MMTPENKAVAYTVAGMLVVLGCAKLALWPLLLKRKTHRYRRIINR